MLQAVPAVIDPQVTVTEQAPLVNNLLVLRDVLRDHLPDPRARLPSAGDEKSVIAHFFHPRLGQTRDDTRQRGRRDAADVALSNAFGDNTLSGFRVWTDELPAA